MRSVGDAPLLAREELYQNWCEWVIANLGRDPALVVAAANAAVDTASEGKGFEAAAEAARVAWKAGKAQRSTQTAARQVRRTGQAAFVFGLASIGFLLLDLVAVIQFFRSCVALFFFGVPGSACGVLLLGTAGLALASAFSALVAITSGIVSVGRKSNVAPRDFAIVGLLLGGLVALILAWVGVSTFLNRP
jgi:hypothetical protein